MTKYLDNIIENDSDSEVAKKLRDKLKEENFNVVISDSKSLKLKDNVYYEVEQEFIWPSMDNDYYTEEGSCRGLRDHIGILVDGTVIPCCLDGEGVISLGNVLSTDLGDILVSERFVNMSEGFKNNTCSEEFCKKCSFKDRFR